MKLHILLISLPIIGALVGADPRSVCLPVVPAVSKSISSVRPIKQEIGYWYGVVPKRHVIPDRTRIYWYGVVPGQSAPATLFPSVKHHKRHAPTQPRPALVIITRRCS